MRVGFIDTGIDYRNQVFRYSDGSTRIFRIWDQTVRSGKKPEGIGYGSEYTRVQINEALQQEDPLLVVPSMDTNGHGTFVAGVTCGSEDIANQFIGAVPLAEIAVVKLKEAKPYLRDFYFIPEGVPAYQENDIMMAVSYLDGLARDPGYAACDLSCPWQQHGKPGKGRAACNVSRHCRNEKKKMCRGSSRE